MNHDEIEIRRLEVETKIGVPDEERATPQKLWISVWLVPETDFTNLNDRVANTVDYADVAGRISTLAGAKSRHLIETLAEETAAELLARFPLRSVAVKIEKRILPDTDFVAVKIRREKL